MGFAAFGPSTLACMPLTLSRARPRTSGVKRPGPRARGGSSGMASFDEGDIGRDCDAPVVVRGSVVARGAQVRGPVVRGRVVASHERLDEARTLQMYGVGAG